MPLVQTVLLHLLRTWSFHSRPPLFYNTLFCIIAEILAPFCERSACGLPEEELRSGDEDTAEHSADSRDGDEVSL